MSERKGISPNLQGSEVHSTSFKFILQCPKCDSSNINKTLYYYSAIKMNYLI